MDPALPGQRPSATRMNPFDAGAPLSVRWFTSPSALAAFLGVVAAGQYGMWIMPPSPEWRIRLWIAALGIFVGAIVPIEFAARRAMKTLAAISAGRLEASAPNLQRAIAEIHAMPRKLLALRIGEWVLLAMGLAAALRWAAPAARWENTIRVAAIGYTIGPLASLLGYFPMVRRARRLIRQTAARGLDIDQLARALPPQRMSLQAGLVVFGVALAAIPTLIVADASMVLATQRAKAVVRISGAAQREAALEPALDGLRFQMLGFAVGLIAVAAVITAALGRLVVEPLRELVERTKRPLRPGADDEEMVIADNEIWALATAFSRQRIQIAAMVEQFDKAIAQISSTTEQILTSSTQHQTGSARQLKALVQTTSTTEELARSAKSVAGNATQVAEIARRTLDSAQQARANAEVFSEAMAQLRRGNEAITQSALELDGCVGQIGKILEFINGIADKSDLLALNAELEGVKAGEVGQGFSLVATEMRRMAEGVMRSTREIEELIERIREATSGVVRATEVGAKTSEGSASQVDAFSKSLSAIVELAGHTSEAVRTISNATQMQQSGTGELADTMGDILNVAKEMEVATKAMIQANVELAWLANDIVSTVDDFRPE